MQVSKWGNSLAVRLPAKLVKEMDLKEGDDVEIVHASSDKIELAKKQDRLELLKALRKHRGLVPADYKFSRRDAYDDGDY